MQDFTTILSNFGFPVAVASYLLFRFEKKLETNSENIIKLTEAVNNLTDVVISINKKRK
jgi:hypothetical protein